MKRMLGVLLTISAICWAQNTGPLNGLATLHPGVTSERASSWDRSGGNADFIVVKAGATVPLAQISGAGEIRHMWFTIASPSPNHLLELVIRMYWDGETEPSVEVPIGDFFGTGFEYEDIPGGHTGQAYQSWHSLPLTVYGKAMNCYFPMPFGKGARITISNDGAQDVPAFYYHIDYEKYLDESATAKEGRFHAQWHHQVTTPIPAGASPPVNLDGKDNYIFMHASGTGQFVGVILAVQGYSTGWWGEGDDMFLIDGAKEHASINGTGMEDYFGSGWMFREEYNYPFVGYSHREIGTGLARMSCIASISQTPSISIARSSQALSKGMPTSARTGTPAWLFGIRLSHTRNLTLCRPYKTDFSSLSGAFRKCNATFLIRIRDKQRENNDEAWG